MKWYAARRARQALVLVLAPAVWACGGRDETQVEAEPGAGMAAPAVRVTSVELGNAIGSDKRVMPGAAASDFRPTDTIYAVVMTEGAATGSTLVARWTYEDGQVVDETRQTISPTGPAVTEFHIWKPDGFPAGDYEVEILLDGRSIEKKEFEVK